MRFILVDEIQAMIPGKSIRASKFVSPEEDYFRDHFPGFPVVPGVLLTEMMAQTAGKCLDAESFERGRSMLARIDSARFSDWVLPGSTAIISAEIQTSRPEFAKAKCRVEVHSRVVAMADLFFAFVPRDRFAAGLRDEVLEAYLARTTPPPSLPPAANPNPAAS